MAPVGTCENRRSMIKQAAWKRHESFLGSLQTMNALLSIPWKDCDCHAEDIMALEEDQKIAR